MYTAHPTEIARVNDEFRKAGFGFTMTTGIQVMSNVNGLLEAIRTFNGFTPDNDPYGEHDFGQLIWNGQKVFWKIDYYNQSLDSWEEPLSTHCRRILTIMLADEY